MNYLRFCYSPVFLFPDTKFPLLSTYEVPLFLTYYCEILPYSVLPPAFHREASGLLIGFGSNLGLLNLPSRSLATTPWSANPLPKVPFPPGDYAAHLTSPCILPASVATSQRCATAPAACSEALPGRCPLNTPKKPKSSHTPVTTTKPQALPPAPRASESRGSTHILVSTCWQGHWVSSLT